MHITRGQAENAAPRHPGAEFDTYGMSNLVVQRCWFEQNTASRSGGALNHGGGGASLSGGSYTMNFCTFVTNTTSSEGGGMNSEAESLKMTGCTFKETRRIPRIAITLPAEVDYGASAAIR